MHAWNVAAGVVMLCAMGCTGTLRPMDDPGSGRGAVPGPLFDRYAMSEARDIPDGDCRGILLGPMFTKSDPAALGPVVLRLDIRHPAAVDLDIRLGYDSDSDGRPEIQAPVEFFRSRVQLQDRTLAACPQSLDGIYLFVDGEEDEEHVFAEFQKAPRGEAFYLSIADTLSGATGSVLGWEIDLQSPQSPVVP